MLLNTRNRTNFIHNTMMDKPSDVKKKWIKLIITIQADGSSCHNFVEQKKQVDFFNSFFWKWKSAKAMTTIVPLIQCVRGRKIQMGCKSVTVINYLKLIRRFCKEVHFKKERERAKERENFISNIYINKLQSRISTWNLFIQHLNCILLGLTKIFIEAFFFRFPNIIWECERAHTHANHKQNWLESISVPQLYAVQV